MAKKKRGRIIGHITPVENRKASEAVSNAIDGCVRTYKKDDEYRACRQGAMMVNAELKVRGFDTASGMGKKRRR